MLLTFVCFFGYSVRRNETCRNSETRTLFVVLRQIEMGEWVAHESEPVPFANATLERSECNNKIWVSVICRHMPFAHDNPQLTRQWSWQTIKPFYRFARSCASVTIRFLVLVNVCFLWPQNWMTFVLCMWIGHSVCWPAPNQQFDHANDLWPSFRLCVIDTNRSPFDISALETCRPGQFRDPFEFWQASFAQFRQWTLMKCAFNLRYFSLSHAMSNPFNTLNRHHSTIKP